MSEQDAFDALEQRTVEANRLPAARLIDVSPDEYHKLPGFSASLARIILSQSEYHARDHVDRQQLSLVDDDDEDDDPKDERKKLDAGNARHALILGVGKRLDVIPAELLSSNGALGTKAGKAYAAAAIAAGRVPLKPDEMERHQRTGDVIKSRIRDAGHGLDGRSEVAIGWWEHTPSGPIECRGMLDHLLLFGPGGNPWSPSTDGTPTSAIIYELKPVPSAHPQRCERTAENLHYAVACAAYHRAVNALYPSVAGRIEFRYLWAEYRRPFALWDPTPSGAYLEIGERRWIRARDAWAAGMATNRWPGYRTPGNVQITCPMWTLNQEGLLA